ncbi:O-antigen ligase family protein [Prevotella sp. E13-27]|uniref:O-antigen ligase family protein n=1 Tax=Prevotella sp. E13-27 TaxID=2938122 RepID=UPI00200A5DC7|nr:O-antigen ligase family protein [Prevotella sp. E13-27]MCK8622042.1 O-antigen ligase family protein [Prevotella sp. E13-27]
MILLACIFILLYGLVQYAKGRKGRGAFVFFFLLTGGFHFLSLDWCPVKYTDFAVVYLVAVALLNIHKGNRKFFKPQIKIYKVATILGVYFALEFVRTIILKEEILSFALASYRTYILVFSFWLVQELKEWEIKRLLKQIASITIVSTVLFDLQPLLEIKILQHASVSETRYRNIPYLAYFFMLLATIRLDFSRWKSVALVLMFLIAIFLTQHRAVMMAYVFCVGLHLLMTKKRGRFLQYGLIGLVFSLFAGEAILSRFEDDKSNRSTIEDIKAVVNLDYETAVNDEFANENGTFSFRVLLLTERLNYMINHPRNAVFGLGTRHEDSPKTQRQFDFFLGTNNHRGGIGQISSADLAWVNPLMHFGFFGIALLLYLSWVISTFFYRNRNISDMTMAAFLYYIFLLLTSFKNDHLYGNMQMFYVYLLIEYIRYSNVKLRVKTE